MYDRLRNYLDQLFADAPQNERTYDLKEEMLQNLIDKYEDLLDAGKPEEVAYGLAISSIGDVSALFEELGGTEPKKEQSTASNRTRSAIFIAVAVMGYILCALPSILIPGDVIGPALTLIMIALSTGLLIYNGITNDKKTPEERRAERKEKPESPLYKAISGVLWTVMIIGYLALSFYTSAWYITWLVFPITGAIDGMIKACFDLKG